MSRCNYCLDSFREKKLPICIEACRTRSLDAGSLQDFKDKYGDTLKGDNFIYSERTKPAIVFKQKMWLNS
ncbi:MAG: hypothetical protein P8Y70_05200 [Candidatus Lokiarchaeota archaeon]